MTMLVSGIHDTLLSLPTGLLIGLENELAGESKKLCFVTMYSTISGCVQNYANETATA